MIIKKLLLATHNLDKVSELKNILGSMDISLISLGDISAIEIEETGTNLKENALLKARAAFRETGIPSIADDTGLEVDYLDGKPGVFSARFAGECATYDDNNRKLLSLMEGIPCPQRTARFRCVAAYADNTCEFYVEGVCEGSIMETPSGAGGFGYDPVFYVAEAEKTFAEMASEEKNRISHRGKAFRKIADEIRNRFS